MSVATVRSVAPMLEPELTPVPPTSPPPSLKMESILPAKKFDTPSNVPLIPSTMGLKTGPINFSPTNGKNPFESAPPINLKLVVTADLRPVPMTGKSFDLARRSSFGKMTGAIYLRAKPPTINVPKVFTSPPRKLPPPPCGSAGLTDSF